MANIILASFEQRSDADKAVDELVHSGYNTKEISVMMKAPAEGENVAGSRATMTKGVVSDTLGGVGTGAVIGGLAGLLIGVAAITIPGLGPLLFAGPLASALGISGATATTVSGVVIGGAAGGLVGLFEGFGATREQAKQYERVVKEGGVVLAVPPKPEKEDEVENILNKHNAQQLITVSVGM